MAARRSGAGHRPTRAPAGGGAPAAATNPSTTIEDDRQLQRAAGAPEHAIPEDRRRLIADLLLATGAVTVAQVESRFGVSAMTARRDLHELERRGLARRTHGGAVLPAVASHEDSFDRRMTLAADAKQLLARAAVRLLGAARDGLPRLLDDELLRRARDRRRPGWR